VCAFVSPLIFTILRCQTSVDLSGAKFRNSSPRDALDHGSSFNALLSVIARLLRQGLGDRTDAIAILHPTSKRQPLSQAHLELPTVVHIGLIHNPQNAPRIVDHGPAADNPDPTVAERFRDFWGDRAELRRFKDGRITESVVWDVRTSDDRTRVPAMIVQHILKRHFNVGVEALRVFQGSFDSLLRRPEPVTRIYETSGIVGGFRAALLAFDDLVKHIRALNGELPLSVSAVSPASGYLRYTSIYSPIPAPSSIMPSLPVGASYLTPMDIVLQFEKSSQWPDDLRAIQKIKLAFLERLADNLMKSMPGTKATIAIGDTMNEVEIQDNCRLEIFTSSGWAFSARIWHEREAILLDSILDSNHRHYQRRRSDDGQGTQERRDALQARQVHGRRFLHATRHHRAVATLCHRFAAYSGTVRLVKRWLSSHWLLCDIAEEAVELICASIFVRGKEAIGRAEIRSDVPRSKERGFLMVVQFLKDWRWDETLVIPLYQRETGDEHSPSPPNSRGVWKLSTELDTGGKVWTALGPDTLSAHRVCTLARATWKVLQRIEHDDFNTKVKHHVPSLSGSRS
jgi:U3 small nucleolar RNA-associated protein 22